jgi:sulfatase maturation enzyme AslB (radical SAM superfamily)
MSDETAIFGLYQVELTAFCDMKCEYCPHPDMRRPKGHMSAETLAKCIEQNKRRRLTNLVLHHFGEPLMHPELGEGGGQVGGGGMTV